MFPLRSHIPPSRWRRFDLTPLYKSYTPFLSEPNGQAHTILGRRDGAVAEARASFSPFPHLREIAEMRHDGPPAREPL